MADPYKDSPWQQGDILRADELNAMTTGLSPLGTVIPWALPFGPDYGSIADGKDPNDYSNVDQFAPFHLPCTGVVYPRSRATELCDAIGHTFVDGSPTTGDVGDYVSGAAILQNHGDPNVFSAKAIYRRIGDGEDASAFTEVEADGFCTPDFRGRSPIGAGGEGVAREWQLGERWGDRTIGWHLHDLQYNREQNNTVGPSDGGTTNYGVQTQANASGNAFRASGTNGLGNPTGSAENYQPSTGVNFLIACGVSGSATPSRRSGEIHRLHAVSSDHMIRQRLADPDLSDEEREALEAILAGEPGAPPVDEPPATRTTTTTRKAAPRKRKKS